MSITPAVKVDNAILNPENGTMPRADELKLYPSQDGGQIGMTVSKRMT
jgi:hypothetical protein